jgi:hypothetical protein
MRRSHAWAGGSVEPDYHMAETVHKMFINKDMGQVLLAQRVDE